MTKMTGGELFAKTFKGYGVSTVEGAVDEDVQHAMPGSHVLGGEGCLFKSRGAIDEDVYRTKTISGCCHHGLYLLPIGYIGPEWQRLDALGTHLISGSLGGVGRAVVVDDYVGPSLGQRQSNGFTHPMGAASNERRFTCGMHSSSIV